MSRKPPYSKTFAVGTTAAALIDGHTYEWAKQLWGGEPSGYLRLLCTQDAMLMFQYGADEPYVPYPEGLTADVPLKCDDPVTGIKIIPAAAGTLTIWAQPESQAPNLLAAMKTLVKKSGLSVM